MLSSTFLLAAYEPCVDQILVITYGHASQYAQSAMKSEGEQWAISWNNSLSLASEFNTFSRDNCQSESFWMVFEIDRGDYTEKYTIQGSSCDNAQNHSI